MVSGFALAHLTDTVSRSALDRRTEHGLGLRPRPFDRHGLALRAQPSYRGVMVSRYALAHLTDTVSRYALNRRTEESWSRATRSPI